MPVFKEKGYRDNSSLSPLGKEVVQLLKFATSSIYKNDKESNILATLASTISNLTRLLRPYLGVDKSELN